MSFIEKILILAIFILVILVHTIDAEEDRIYLEKQCELTPQWSKCQ